MDANLTKYKKLFIGIGVTLGVLALWHLYYVTIAIKATGHDFLLNEYGMLALGLSMLALCVGIFLLCTERSVTGIWLIAFLLLGISCMRVMPGLSAPDEPAHYISAYYLSNQLMMAEADDEEGHVYIRAKDAAIEDVQNEREQYLAGEIEACEIFGQEPLEKNYFEARKWENLHPCSDTGMTTSTRIRVETTPLVYLPQAIGITIARILGTGSMTLLTLAKLCNLIAFAAMAYWAINRMPFGKELMMASTLLPMTINLAASMSYDAMLIGCIYMFTAEVFHLAYGEEKVGWKNIVLLAVLLAVMSPCKMVYCIVTALLLFIPKEKYESRGMMAAAWAICIAAALGSIILVNAMTISRYATAAGNELVWAGGEEGFTAGYVIRHPVQTIRMVYDTFLWNGGYYHQTMIGAYLGNTNESLDVPYIIIMIITAALVIIGLKARKISGKNKIIIAAIAVILMGLLMGSMLIGWTPLSSMSILGVQGRYFIPVLPLLLLLLPNEAVTVNGDNAVKISLFIIIACDAFAFFRMYSMVCLHV